MQDYKVTFAGIQATAFSLAIPELTVHVTASDAYDAQELAIESAEQLQGFSTAITSIRRVN